MMQDARTDAGGPNDARTDAGGPKLRIRIRIRNKNYTVTNNQKTNQINTQPNGPFLGRPESGIRIRNQNENQTSEAEIKST